jgi:hypothetical protein
LREAFPMTLTRVRYGSVKCTPAFTASFVVEMASGRGAASGKKGSTKGRRKVDRMTDRLASAAVQALIWDTVERLTFVLTLRSTDS